MSADMGPPGEILLADPAGVPFPIGENGNAASCYDGYDNDGDGAADCADAICRSLGSCCVATADCRTALAGFPLVLDPIGCADGSAETCFAPQGADLDAIGAPRIENGAFVGAGDVLADAGLWIGAAIDLATERAEVTIDVTAPADCDATCLESLTVAIGRTALGGVDPVVALVLAPALGEASLVAGGEAILRTSDPSAGRYTLIARPDGSVTVLRGALVLFDAPQAFVPSGSARIALYGRNRPPGGSAPISVSRIAIDLALSDMPTAWGSRTPVTVLDSGTPIDFAPESMAAASNGTTIWLALAHAGAITVATADASAPDDFTVVDELAPAFTADVAGLRAPALVADAATTTLFYLGDGGSGLTFLLRGTAPAGLSTFARDGSPIATLPDARSIGVAARPDGVLALIVHSGPTDRVTDASFAAYALGGATPLALDRARVALGALDATQVGASGLLNRAGAWELLVDVRRGTRGGIALFASHEAVFWRTVATDPVLEGAPGTSDALGVRTPAAFVAPNGDVTLYYVGTDGARETLMRTTRRAAERGTF